MSEINDATQHCDEWHEAAASGTYTPISRERIEEIFLWTTQHGPPNCWTGTTGTAAAMIRELLRERVRLLHRIEEDEIDVDNI